MAHDRNQEFRTRLREMTGEFRNGVREAAHAARDHALAEDRVDDPLLRMAAERLDRELVSQKASLAKRFAPSAPEGSAAPSEGADN